MTVQSTGHLHSGIKLLLLLGTLCFVMHLLVNSLEFSRDLDGHIQPKEIFYGSERESKRVRVSSLLRTADCHILPGKRNSCNKLPNFFLYKDRREDFKDAIINFWHIQKTSGSTMYKCLQTMYKELKYPPPFRCMAWCNSFSQLLDNSTYLTDLTHKPIVYGHYSLGMCDFIREEITDRKCSVFTIFREPYERAVSHYYFHRQRAKTNPGFRAALELPVDEWVKKMGSITWSSFFFSDWKFTTDENGKKKCTRFAVNRSHSYSWPQSQYLMDGILNNLDKHLSFIGLFEDRLTTYKMLQEIYDIPFYDVCSNIYYKKGEYESVNGTSQRALKKKTKQILLEDKELQELMKFDVMLYEKAKEIFYAQKNEFENMNH